MSTSEDVTVQRYPRRSTRTRNPTECWRPRGSTDERERWNDNYVEIVLPPVGAPMPSTPTRIGVHQRRYAVSYTSGRMRGDLLSLYKSVAPRKRHPCAANERAHVARIDLHPWAGIRDELWGELRFPLAFLRQSLIATNNYRIHMLGFQFSRWKVDSNFDFHWL